MYVVLVSIILVGILMVGSAFLPRLLGIGRKLSALRSRRAVAETLVRRMQVRLQRRGRELRTATAQLATTQTRRRLLIADLEAARAATQSTVRIVEAPDRQPGCQVWMAKVVNVRLEMLVPRPGGFGHFDESWSVPQTVLVHAPDPAEARRMVERVLPAALGFSTRTIERAPRHLAALVEPEPAGGIPQEAA